MKKLFTFSLLLALSLGCSSKKETARQNQPTEELEILETSGQEKIDWSFVDGPPPGFSGRPKEAAKDFHGKANKPVSRISEFEKTENTLAQKEAEPSDVTNRISNGTGEKEPQPDFRESEKKNHNTPFLLTLGAMAVAGIFSVRRLFKKRNRMNDWAAENPKKSIAILTLSRIGLAVMALLGGHYLGTQGVVTTEETTYGLLGLSALTYAVASKKSKKKGKSRFLRTKVFSFIIMLLGIGAIANFGNRGASESNLLKHTGPYIEKIENTASKLFDIAYPNPENDKTGNKVVKGFIVFSGLLLGLAALALLSIIVCYIHCSGHEQIALMVLSLGIIGILIGVVWWVRKEFEEIDEVL